MSNSLLFPGWMCLALGLIVGSFLNVCIYRLPRGLSVVRPPSACPGCATRIRWYDNVPVFSFLLLRGRCRACGRSISLQYPLVELATGLLFLAASRDPLAPAVLLGTWSWISFLIIVTVVDLHHRIIPDALTLPGTLLALGVRALRTNSLSEGLLGLAVGGGILFLVGWLYRRATGIEGMGEGDVKLMAMVGAFLGWRGALVVIFLGSVAGAAVGITLMFRRRAGRRTALPFGTFLAPTALAVLLAGSWLWNRYWELVW